MGSTAGWEAQLEKVPHCPHASIWVKWGVGVLLNPTPNGVCRVGVSCPGQQLDDPIQHLDLPICTEPGGVESPWRAARHRGRVLPTVPVRGAGVAAGRGAEEAAAPSLLINQAVKAPRFLSRTIKGQ